MTDTQVYLDFAALVDKAIEINMINREHMRKNKHLYDPITWLIECCTIHVSAGRKTGKTTYATMKADKNTLIIVPHKPMADNHPANRKGVDVCDIQFIMSPGCRLGKRYNTVIIEEPNLVFIGKGRLRRIREVYDKITNYAPTDGSDQTFILLGE